MLIVFVFQTFVNSFVSRVKIGIHDGLDIMFKFLKLKVDSQWQLDSGSLHDDRDFQLRPTASKVYFLLR